MFRAKKAQPIRSADDLACDGIFETDEELEEFLTCTYAARRADLAWPVDRVVLDTDVASRSFKRQLPPQLLGELIGSEPATTFVTQGELTKWAVRRQWGTLRQERMARWLSRIPVLHSSDDIAAVWGEIVASAERRGRPRPQNDTWVAACCLAYELPLATLNVKDFRDFAHLVGGQQLAHLPRLSGRGLKKADRRDPALAGAAGRSG